MTPIDRDEFRAAMLLLRDDIHGVQDRLDTLNGRVRENEIKIAVLEDRGHPAAWGGGVGACVAAIAEIGKWFFTK